MGKKRILKQSSEEAIKETEAQESVEKKAVLRKGKKTKFGDVSHAHLFIRSTYNNTLISIANTKGQVIAWASSGSVGFKGPKKATPFAASKVIDALMEKVKNLRIKDISIFVKGVGSGRDSAIRTLANYDLNILNIKDITPTPHNGCRLPRPKRQ